MRNNLILGAKKNIHVHIVLRLRIEIRVSWNTRIFKKKICQEKIKKELTEREIDVIRRSTRKLITSLAWEFF